ncbi:DUF2911 domain-containing protein [Robiginitalea marina]|uniref:DUF2911 domain-containing protein n=1 Tax=Robiginitalea marina TaxID=2954105 RepID=A0ABT1ATX6_9FLAO|nr:DUF2911 domain-containing protein [Robiginitalea marina]MCO5723381.1 DUF2911 domain-containing protein [Robiginitalea marina]
MRKIILFLFALALAPWGQAQIQTPAPSPASTLNQMVGLTEVTVTYSRPSMRGRTVFGDLVPYGTLWRTGANANSTVSFSDPVTIAGNEVKADTYAIFTKPGADAWEVYFYSDTNNWGTPAEWDESKVAAMASVPVKKTPWPVETFTMTVDDLTNNGATLSIHWENTTVQVPFEVPTKAKAMKSIETAMGGPSGNDYFSAASYYYQEGLDLSKAKEWVDKAVAMNPDAFWMARQQSLIYAKMGDRKGAIEAAKKSLAAAQKAGNADYVKMNQDSLKEWGAM